MKVRVICGSVFIFFLSICINFAHASPDILVGTAQGIAGDSVSIPVDINTGGDSVHLQFNLLYDASVLVPGSPTGGDALTDHTVDSNVVGPGHLRVVIYSLTNAPLSPGQMVKLPVSIATNAPPGTYPLAVSEVVISDSSGQEVVATQMEGGIVTVLQAADPILVPNLGVPGYLLLIVLLLWTAFSVLKHRNTMSRRVMALLYTLSVTLLIIGSPTALAALPGDSDNDGDIDTDDILLSVSVILERSSAPGDPDCNQDTMVNVLDLPCQIAAAENTAPDLIAPGDRQIQADTSFLTRLFAIDPDPGDILSFSVASGPTGLTCNPSTGDLLWTPGFADLGSHTVTVRVTDLKGATDSENFTIHVIRKVATLSTNSAPDLLPIVDQILEPDESLEVQAQATDPDAGDTLTYSLPRGPAGMGIDAMTGLIQWTPGPDQARQHDVTVLVTDSGGLSDAEVFFVNAKPQNNTPEAVDDVYIARMGKSLGISAPGVLENDSDPDGDAIQATLVQGPDNGTLNLSPDGSFNYMATAPQIAGNFKDVNLVHWLRPHYQATDKVDPYVFGNAVDGDLNTSWIANAKIDSFTYWFIFDGDLKPTVSELRIYGNRGALADEHDIFSGRFLLTDASGAVLFESEELDLPLSDRDLVFPIPGGPVSNVHRVEFIFSEFENKGNTEAPFPLPGFSEFEVIGEQEVLDVTKEWAYTPVEPYHWAHVVMSPAVGDITEDGIPDVIFTSGEQTVDTLECHLRGLNGADGSEIFFASHSDTDFYDDERLNCRGQVTLADIDGDNKPEILAFNAAHIRRSQFIKAFKYDVSTDTINMLWTSDKMYPPLCDGVPWYTTCLPWMPRGGGGHGTTSGPMVADLDADSIPEIIFGYPEQGVSVFDNSGHLLWNTLADIGMPYAGGLGYGASPYAVDLDLDGKPEILAGNAAYTEDGQIHWLSEVGKDGFTAVANFDDDPYPEIVHIDQHNYIRLLEHDGTIKWGGPSSEFGGGGRSNQPIIADFDGDGRPEIGVQERGRYKVYRADGTIHWQRKVSGSFYGGSTAFDFDGDGAFEAVVTDGVDLVIFRGTDGAILFRTPMRNEWGQYAPVVADVDGDGHAEIIAVASRGYDGNDGVHVFGGANDDWLPTRKIWNQDVYHVTNVNDDLTIPVTQQYNWLISGLNNFRVNVPYLSEGGSDDRFTYKADDGVLESNEATVFIDIQPPNAVPVILSEAKTNATAGFVYSYWVVATDSDKDPLTYSLNDSPANMTIDPLIGSINWAPGNTDLGEYQVIVSVTDNKGGVAIQQFTLTVEEPVIVPDLIGETQADAETLITSAGLDIGSITDGNHISVAAGLVARQSLPANSVAEPGSILDFILSSGPAPEDIDNDEDGFTENNGDCNDADNAIHPGATDPAGDGVDQDCNGIDGDLTITEILVEPAISTVLTGQTVQHTATAIFEDGTSQNISGLVTWSSTDPGKASVDASGLVTALDPGSLSIQVLFDGHSGNANFTVHGMLADDVPPVAEISAPGNDSTITAPVEITGTVSDDNFLKYTLAIAPAGEQEFALILSNTTPITGGVLGVFDPSVLINDLYTLRLTVFDRGGNTTTVDRSYQVDGDLKVGLFSLSFNDLEIPMAGIPIKVVRSYDSRNKQRGDFGIGWNLIVQTFQLRTNRVFGTGWEVFKSGISSQMFPNDMHKVSISLPDGQVEEFDMTVSPNPSLIVPFTSVNASFAPRPGTRGTLECLDDTALLVVGAQPGEVTLTDFSVNTFEPQNFRYTDLNGIQYVVNLTEGVKSITDQNGNTITFGPAGIIHSAGKSVIFTRDSQGRIITLTDPNGNQQAYSYDANGDLQSHTDPEDHTTRFFYNHHHGLIRIEDPLGRQIAKNEYDLDGRLIAVTDAAGNRVEYAHDISGRQEVETDRSGGVTLYHYDEQGNVLSETDPLGNTTTFTYDAQGNQLSQTNALGQTTSYGYDVNGYETHKTNPLGDITLYSRGTDGVLLALTDANGGITTGTYDGTGNQTSKTDPEGNTLTSSFDTRGNAILSTDCQGRVTAYEYDGFGNVIKKTDALGHVIHYTYDANGNRLTVTQTRTTESGVVNMTTIMEYDKLDRLIKTTDAEGYVERIEYALNGKRSVTEDKNGNRTLFEYDVMGNLAKVTLGDGNFQANSYDANGNKISSTDKAGRTTVYEFDALNRNTRIIHPDGSDKTFEYDAAGRLIASTDENGNRSTYQYDAAGRRNRTTDPLGNETSISYDANGNMVSITDANGQVTSFEYDANNRKIRSTYPDATFTTFTYAGSCSENIQSETDPAGNTTAYEYDAAGRLITVVDSLGNRSSYGYDEVGNRLTETAANGNTTTWAYDNTGHVVKQVLALGMIKRFIHDPNGNVLSQVDFNGDTSVFTYDSLNRLVQKDFPDGSSVQYEYTADGQRHKVIDARGQTVYSYDARGRLSNVLHPDLSNISYSYDEVGNKLAVTTPAGATINTYDSLNRLQTVTAPDSGVTAYRYDNVGNRSDVTYPNGSVTTYNYDTLNRLVQLVTTKSDSTVVSGYTYTLGSAGNRVQVVEHSGRVVDYTYDAVYRLIGEDFSSPGKNDTITYSYDAVGNRLSKSDNSGTTLYTYDNNNQLLSAGSMTYSYDANGNRIGMSGGSGNASYTYDYENRMTTAQAPGQLTAYDYDADGIRVASSLNGIMTRYLVDKNRPYAQVIEERDFTGSVIVSYVFGDDLISQHRSSSQSYYIYDGSGSTRQLINFIETVTDTYTYDAFGVEVDRSGRTPNRYLYTGEQYDSNVGFYYLRARYYDHLNGRFTSRDPFVGSIYDPESLHKYLYANANPVMYTDPSGMRTLAEGVAVIGLMITVMPTIHATVAGSYWLFAQRVLAWNGWALPVSAGEVIGGGGIGIGLKSECAQVKQGQFKRGSGLYIALMGGLTVSVPLAPAGAVYGALKLNTPGFLGSDPNILVGMVTWWSATVAVPGVVGYADRRGNDSTTRALGVSNTVFLMAFGVGEWGWSPVLGLSIGIDMMSGFSAMTVSDQFECWQIEQEEPDKRSSPR